MTNEAPDRIWFHIDGAFLPYQPTMHWEWNEYIRKDAACVEVKEGYCLQATEWCTDHYSKRVPLSEALTIRTVEDVRREVMSVAGALADELEEFVNGDERFPEAQAALDAYAALSSDAPAPSREKKQVVYAASSSNAEPPQPTPTPEPEPVAWQYSYADPLTGKPVWRMKSDIWNGQRAKEGRPLYASPPTPTPQPDELRKAKAEAWDEGFSACEDPNLDIRCNPYAAPEGGEK